MLQRTAVRSSNPGGVPPIVHDVLREPGQSLDLATRSLMEQRFGRDFSSVRVHAGAKAARSADSIDAHAYTAGTDIAFGEGRFEPHTLSGRKLIAHELTHVVQQLGAPSTGSLDIAPAASSLERQASAVAEDLTSARTTSGARASNLIQRAPREGTSVYDESAVSVDPSDPKAPGVVSGRVTRKEFGDKGKLIHQMDARVRFDSKNCTVSVPVGIAYREATAADLASFKSVNPTLNAKAAPKSVGRATFDRYISVVNEKLNGWFALEFGECKGSPCSGHITRVNVDVTEDNTNPDYTVSVVDGGSQGRSAVFPSSKTVVLAGEGGDVSKGTLAHEGGHMALGHGDEYREQTLPGSDPSRVRPDDFSRMSEHHDYGEWSVFHERHFAFVPSFLTAAFKSLGTPCTPKLQALSRPRLDMSVDFSTGGASFTGSRAMVLSGGVGVGLLSTSRNWRGFLEARATLLSSLDSPLRTAYLLGARLGIDGRFTPSSGGLFLGGYAEAGKGFFNVPDATKPGTFNKTSFTSPYGEAGVRAGYGFAPTGGLIIKVFGEAAAGTSLNIHDPNQQYWFRTGLGAGFEF
ncbi:MAG: DUF4157 domain-containing protein [Gemmatimonadales bacterium]